MKRRLVPGLLGLGCLLAAAAIGLSLHSSPSRADTGTAPPTWAVDDQMQPFHPTEVWRAPSGSAPTSAQHAVDVATDLVGRDNIQGTVRVRYVLVSTPWDHSAWTMKDRPMWAVEFDKLRWHTHADRGDTSLYDSKSEVLVDANTGRYVGQFVFEIDPKNPDWLPPTPAVRPPANEDNE